MAVKLNKVAVIKAQLGLEPSGPVQSFFTQTCYNHMDKYVPFDSGDLSSVVDIQTDSITYDSEYANYQYKGVREDGTHPINPNNRNREYHPLATSYWDQEMVSAEINDVIKEVQEYFNKHGG